MRAKQVAANLAVATHSVPGCYIMANWSRLSLSTRRTRHHTINWRDLHASGVKFAPCTRFSFPTNLTHISSIVPYIIAVVNGNVPSPSLPLRCRSKSGSNACCFDHFHDLRRCACISVARLPVSRGEEKRLSTPPSAGLGFSYGAWGLRGAFTKAPEIHERFPKGCNPVAHGSALATRLLVDK